MKLLSGYIIIFLSLLFCKVVSFINPYNPALINYLKNSNNQDCKVTLSTNDTTNDTDIQRAIKYLAPSYFALIVREIIPDPERITNLLTKSTCLSKYFAEGNDTKIIDLIKYSSKSFPDYGDEEGCLSMEKNYAFLLFTLNYYIKNPNDYKGKFGLLPFISKGFTYFGLCLENEVSCKNELYERLESLINNKQIEINGLESVTMKTFVHTKNDSKEKKIDGISDLVIYLTILSIYVIIRIIVWIIGYRFFKEKEDYTLNKYNDEDDSSEEEEEEDESRDQTSTKEQTDDKKELLEKKEKVPQISKKNLYQKFHIIYKICSFAESFKLIFRKENYLFSEKDLYFIIFFRVIALFTKIVYINFNFFIHNPSKEINNTDIFETNIIGLIKFSSFSDVIFIMTESIIVSYKLMSFIKKYANRNEGPSLGLFVNFFLRIIPSIFIIVLNFLVFYLFNNILISIFMIIGVDYFHTKIQNMKVNLMNCYSCISNVSNLIPFYMNYHNFIGHTNTNESCFQFMIIMTNMFYCYCFCIILTFLCFKIKKSLFDIIISLIFLVGFFLPNEFSCEYFDYFNINVILGENCSTTYTHLFIKYYFFGFLIGFALFYDQDLTQDNSLQNSQIYLPFHYLKDLIGLLFKSSNWVHLLITIITILIQALLSMTFYFFIKNDFKANHKNVQLSGFDNYLILNEKTYFSLAIGIFITHLYTYRNEQKLVQFGNNIFFIFFHRNGYAFYTVIEVMVNIIYCALGLNYSMTSSNLSYISYGMIFHITVMSLSNNILFYIPIKSLINKCLRSKKKVKI